MNGVCLSYVISKIFYFFAVYLYFKYSTSFQG